MLPAVGTVTCMWLSLSRLSAKPSSSNLAYQEFSFGNRCTKCVLVLVQPTQKPWEHLLEISEQHQFIGVVSCVPQRVPEIVTQA
mmetsp:Transcript_1188/g.2281  ORF Transcript_1188/g.2281 Transcript_1188/m.2281 type:complete len:84 (-) Transcript_1188:108-359(-)